MVYGKSIHLRALRRGGSIDIKPRADTDSNALVDPSFAIQNKSGRLMQNDVSKSFSSFPLSAGIPTATGSANQTQSMMPKERNNKNYLGGALDIKFGKKKKDEKVKLKI